MIPAFDVFIIIILFTFILWGAIIGIAGMAGNLLGFIVGITISGKYYTILADFIHNLLPKINEQFINIVSFIVVLSIIGKIVSLLVNLLFKVISFIPLAKTINRLAGGLIGLIAGILIAGAVVFMLSRYPISPWIGDALILSKLSPILLVFFKPLAILLPDVLRELKSLI